MLVLLNFVVHQFQRVVRQRLHIDVPHNQLDHAYHALDDRSQTQHQYRKIPRKRTIEQLHTPFHSNSKENKKSDIKNMKKYENIEKERQLTMIMVAMWAVIKA